MNLKGKLSVLFDNAIEVCFTDIHLTWYDIIQFADMHMFPSDVHDIYVQFVVI